MLEELNAGSTYQPPASFVLLLAYHQYLYLPLPGNENPSLKTKGRN